MTKKLCCKCGKRLTIFNQAFGCSIPICADCFSGQSNRVKRDLITGICAISGMLAFLLVFFLIVMPLLFGRKEKRIAAFESHVREYLSIQIDDAHRRNSHAGHVVFVDCVSRDLHDISRTGSPSDLVARTPEEVKTIALIKNDLIEVGSYQGIILRGAGQEDNLYRDYIRQGNRLVAFRVDSEVTLVDKESRQLVDKTTLLGSTPPQKIDYVWCSHGTYQVFGSSFGYVTQRGTESGIAGPSPSEEEILLFIRRTYRP